MNEIDVLNYFYDVLRSTGQTRDTLFLSLDESVVEAVGEKIGKNIPLEELHHVADICIANQWLERTTPDPAYNYLSLTEAGLQVAISYQYSKGECKGA